ncbi:MAG: alpha/beta hydrolase [Oscillibacter sp.]|jgi:pimeloyl-ACP methyl ester carboxylesterase|nr:alpha/beta hydrolase [Oscillibacter sp.]
MTWLWILLVILAVFAAAFAAYVHNNLTYDQKPIAKLPGCGFAEKQVTLPDGTVLNYGEGPKSGAPLLLIHGQGVTWQDYAKVLPELAKKFHIYAVDCHGHGKSSFCPEKYSAAAIGKDLIWYLQNIVGEPAYVSGHSSGGLMTVWLAANAPEWVRGIAIEDAPLFSTEEPEKKNTFAYQSSFSLIHDFLHQTEEKNYFDYYLQHTAFQNMIGKGWPKMVEALNAYRRKHPDRKPKVWYLPPSVNAIWVSVSDPYDPLFGETFYDQSWFAGFDQAEALARITCPAVFLKAATRWNDDVLMAALSEEDCQKVCSLIPGCRRIDFPKSGHDIHQEKPAEFVQAVETLL